MKDNFSQQSDEYAQYRPVYPEAYFNFILSVTRERNTAWDCGTGNGQVAEQLSRYFEKVHATDISQQQISRSVPNNKIEYSVQPAEQTIFPDQCFDLIVVAQAIHWFDFDLFYNEAKRTLKKEGVISIVGYNRPMVSPEIDEIITYFYKDIVGPYWDAERKYVDERYHTIPFPFEEIDSPKTKIALEWNFEHLIGYLGTWSAVKHFIKDRGTNPLEKVYDQLKKAWGNMERRTVSFPLLLKTGRLSE
jgi:SAM-dependent methyltransferase